MKKSIFNDLLIIIGDKDELSSNIIEILNRSALEYIIVSNIRESIYENLYGFQFPKFSSSPYPYIVVDNLVARKIKRYNLIIDKELELWDNHIHTQLAYCSENMSVEKNIKLAKLFGLKGIRITEHADHLYFNSSNYSDIECYTKGISYSFKEDYRIKEFLEYKKKFSDDFVEFGVEVGIDFNGELLIDPEDLQHFDYILGAIHVLKECTANGFISTLEKLLKHDIDVLAHPFRIFKRSGVAVPNQLFKPVAKLLKEYNTAAEINFHTNEPPVDFIKECLSLGVKFCFGSDSHNLAEIGDFSYQLNLLKEAGFFGDLKEIMWS